MKRFLIAVVLVVAIVVGLGFYRGWFHVSTGQSDHKADASVAVDEDKVREDKERAEQKIKAFEQKVQEKTSAAADKKNSGSGSP